MRREGAYVVSHLAHQLAGEFQKDELQIRLARRLAPRLEFVDALRQISRKGYVGEDLKILGGEEGQASLALDLPELAVCVDDAMAWTEPTDLLLTGPG